MPTRAIHLLTVALCLTLAGGAQACLCNGLQRTVAKKADARACCPANSTPAPNHRCHACDLTATISKATAPASATELDALLSPPHSSNSPATPATHSQSITGGEISISPNLRDLYHLFTQLTE